MFLLILRDGESLTVGKRHQGVFPVDTCRDGYHVGVRYHVNTEFLYEEINFSVCWVRMGAHLMSVFTLKSVSRLRL